MVVNAVLSMLNGEVFLPATNIVGNQPDFSGIPSELFAGTRTQDKQFYLNASVAYNINDRWQVFPRGSNLTNCDQTFYYVWPDLKEYSTGLTARLCQLQVLTAGRVNNKG